MNIIFLIAFIVNIISCDAIATRCGFIKGKFFKTRGGALYRAFYGIPYAFPPVGELRFQAPVEAGMWDGVLDGTAPRSKCPQPEDLNTVAGNMDGEEDCLYLNVFTPDNYRTPNKIPVIVYIHGGAHIIGEGAYHRPEYLLDNHIILVTLNFRLGALGFLGMGNDVIPGNFGFKDQVMALKWVRDNIISFNGDPNSITLMGHSAGASSVHLHLFSPLSKGLFHRVIMQSGIALSTWSYYDEPLTKFQGDRFANITGCNHADGNKMLECLQKLPLHEIMRKQNELRAWYCNPVVLFKAAIETNVSDAFLPHRPTLNNYVSHVPWLTGMTSSDAAFLVVPYLINDGKLAKEVNASYKRLLPLINEFFFTVHPDDLDNVTEQVKQFYFGNRDIGPETDLAFVRMVTDALFTYPLINSVRHNEGTQYVYLYDHRAAFSFQDSANYSRDLGVSHSDELPMLFYFPEVEKLLSKNDFLVSTRLIELWINFAKYGDPSGLTNEKLWKPVSTGNIEYLHIRTNASTMETNLFKERYRFWRSLPLRR